MLLLAFVLTLLSTLCLSLIYAQTSSLFGIEPWLAAAAINSLIALPILILYCRKKHPHPALAYLPATALLIGILLAVGISRQFGNPAATSDIASAQWLFVLWIPLIEESVFRLGFSKILGKMVDSYSAAYLSALGFAYLHSSPSFEKLLHLDVAIPLGPLFLALICEAMRMKWKALLPIVCFHMVCNLSVILFATIDNRWLTWLRFLYG